MLAILFPHLYEDIEYLLPPEELGPRDTQGGAGTEGSRTQRGVVAVQENAVAGSSRIS